MYDTYFLFRRFLSQHLSIQTSFQLLYTNIYLYVRSAYSPTLQIANHPTKRCHTLHSSTIYSVYIKILAWQCAWYVLLYCIVCLVYYTHKMDIQKIYIYVQSSFEAILLLYYMVLRRYTTYIYIIPVLLHIILIQAYPVATDI